MKKDEMFLKSWIFMIFLNFWNIIYLDKKIGIKNKIFMQLKYGSNPLYEYE